jgi:hypothetical protein
VNYSFSGIYRVVSSSRYEVETVKYVIIMVDMSQLACVPRLILIRRHLHLKINYKNKKNDIPPCLIVVSRHDPLSTQICNVLYSRGVFGWDLIQMFQIKILSTNLPGDESGSLREMIWLIDKILIHKKNIFL